MPSLVATSRSNRPVLANAYPVGQIRRSAEFYGSRRMQEVEVAAGGRSLRRFLNPSSLRYQSCDPGVRRSALTPYEPYRSCLHSLCSFEYFVAGDLSPFPTRRWSPRQSESGGRV